MRRKTKPGSVAWFSALEARTIDHANAVAPPSSSCRLATLPI